MDLNLSCLRCMFIPTWVGVWVSAIPGNITGVLWTGSTRESSTNMETSEEDFFFKKGEEEEEEGKPSQLVFVINVSSGAHLRSCVCPRPARSPRRTRTCSFPACWRSAVRSGRCQAWNTHPSLHMHTTEKQEIRAAATDESPSTGKRILLSSDELMEDLNNIYTWLHQYVRENGQKIKSSWRRFWVEQNICERRQQWVILAHNASYVNFDIWPLKKLAAKPALLTEPSDTNFIHSWLELVLRSSGLS